MVGIRGDLTRVKECSGPAFTLEKIPMDWNTGGTRQGVPDVIK